MPPPRSDLLGMALVNDRRDFFNSPISPINSSMRGSRDGRAGATATAAAVPVRAADILALMSFEISLCRWCVSRRLVLTDVIGTSGCTESPRLFLESAEGVALGVVFSL